MLAAVAALVLSQDSSLIDPGPSGVSSPTAKGDNPAVDTYPGSVPPDYVLTDAGIDTTCTDIDFKEADVTVSNLGGTDHCCNICGAFLCCPTVNEDDNGMDIVKVPIAVTNARQIFDPDYMMYNTCHGSAGAELQGEITPHEGSTSYIKLSGVNVVNQDDSSAPPINLIVKNTTEYTPAWPILGKCKNNNCVKGSDFTRNHANGDTLKPAGYLNNGRKTGALQANDLLQVNLCEDRFLNLKTSFVDNDDKDVTLMQSTMRFFDIDHGNAENQGPEVMQFDCTGGTFTLYGAERVDDEDVPDLEFLMHISDDARAGHRPDDYGTTANGLGIHVYDCPANKLVTLWSSRFGVGKDNPTSSVIPVDPVNGRLQERSMVQIDMYNINEFEVAFGVLDQEYQEGYAITKKKWNSKKNKWVNVKDADGNNVLTGEIGKADPVKLKRLQDGLALSHANYPEQESGACPYDVSGRNWLFAGMKGVAEKSCPPPAPPPSSPPPSSPPPGCFDTTCANGEYASANDPDSVAGDATCMPCDSACDTCVGPGSDDCTICPMACPQAPTDGKCANGEYSMGDDCLPCDASCITGTIGPESGLPSGDSCTGPEASQCTKCPYLCDPSCDGESSPSYADWSDGSLECKPCDPSCTSCTGPDADQCTTCNEECDVSQCAHGTYPHGSECRDCDASCEFCTGPGSTECATCPKACEISQCANGEYAMGVACESCDASCTASGAGIGESCVGPEAGDCVKCPYECDESCAGETDPSFADWTSGSLVCSPCDTSCTGTGDGTGAGCTGPGADECTTCLEPPPPSPPPSPLPSSPPVEVPDLPDFPEEPPEEEETEEDVEIVPPTSCGAGTCKKGEYSNSGSCAPCDACCDSCSGPGSSDCTSCDPAPGCSPICPSGCKEEGTGCGTLADCAGCALGVKNAQAAAAAACVIAAIPNAPPSSTPSPGTQIFDDPHVRTLSGNQFFMHGVGVFDYASIPNVITTQVYLCPFAPCTAEMMEMGDCLTFIQAVAVKLEKGHPNKEHLVVWRNNAMRVDTKDRKAEKNMTLGSQTTIRASGRGSATAHPDRVQHESLADCHVLAATGQRTLDDIESTPAREGSHLQSVAGTEAAAHPLASEPYPRAYVKERVAVDAPLKKGERGWAWADRGVPLSEDEKLANARAGARVPEGGVWAECTNNEWTLSTPQMTMDVGVIGPFEEGYLRERVSNRTFNLNIVNVADKDALQGIVNGDKNGLFEVMEDLNPPTGGPVDENVGALVPKGPHGSVQEVTAANVAPHKVLFPAATMAEMDKACGEQQSLRAIRLNNGKNGDGDFAGGQKMWKDFKSRRATRLNGDDA